MTETGTKDVRAAGRSGAVDREALVRAALDEIVQGNSQLLSRAAVNEMICAAVDELSANVPGEVDLTGVIDSLKTAVRTTPDLGYEDEMGALFSLFDEVSALDASSLDSLDLAGLGALLAREGDAQ